MSNRYYIVSMGSGAGSTLIGFFSFLLGTTNSEKEGWLYPHMPTIGAYMFSGGLIIVSLLSLIQLIVEQQLLRTQIEKKVIRKASHTVLYLAIIFLASATAGALY